MSSDSTQPPLTNVHSAMHDLHRSQEEQIPSYTCVSSVDDMIQTGHNVELKDEFLTFLRETFTLTDDAPIKWFLGIAFERCDETGNIFASQTAYLDRSLEKFNINRLKNKQTPMDDKFKLSPDDLCPNPTQEDTHML